MRGDSFQLQGQQGGRCLATGSVSPAGENYRWLLFLNDTVLGDIGTMADAPPIMDQDSIFGQTLPAGMGIGGNFKGITVTSGLMIAYYH